RKEIKQSAKEAWEAGPLPLSEDDRKERWSELRNALKNLDYCKRQEDALMAVSRVLDQIVDAYFDFSQQWRPSPGLRMDALNQIEPRFRNKIREAMALRDATEAIEKTKEIFQDLVDKFGPLPNSSQSNQKTEKGGMWKVAFHPFRLLWDWFSGRWVSHLNHVYKILKIFVWPHKRYLMTLFTLSTLSGLASFPIVFVVALAYYSLQDFYSLMGAVFIGAILVVLSNLLNILTNLYQINVSERLWYVYSMRITRHILGRDDLVNEYSSGELSYRLSEDTQRSFDGAFELIQTVLDTLARIILLPLAFFILPVKIVFFALWIGIITGVIYSVASAVIYKRETKVTRLRGELTGREIEALNHIENVNLERMRQDVMDRVKDKAKPLRNQIIGLASVVEWMNGGVHLVTQAAPILVIIIIARAVSAGTLDPGMAFGVAIWLAMIIGPIRDFFAMGPDLQRLLVHGGRFLEVYDPKHTIKHNQSGSEDFPDYQREIRLTNLVFRYKPSDDPLIRAHKKIPLKNLTSIIGPSGSGKTTFLKLLNRNLSPSKGQITINDTPINKIDMDQWKKNVVFVPQNDFTVEDTVLRNLSLGHGKIVDATEAKKILRQVKLWSTLQPRGGLDYELPETEELSAGERKRLCLARALLHDPNILLLDEIVGVLDPELENQIIDILEEVAVTEDTAIIYVAHRPSAANRADQILRIMNGNISIINNVKEETGTS
ncbi:MAG: ATP-binding cassette domain-containing protein, partial [bacterium]